MSSAHQHEVWSIYTVATLCLAPANRTMMTCETYCETGCAPSFTVDSNCVKKRRVQSSRLAVGVYRGRRCQRRACGYARPNNHKSSRLNVIRSNVCNKCVDGARNIGSNWTHSASNGIRGMRRHAVIPASMAAKRAPAVQPPA